MAAASERQNKELVEVVLKNVLTEMTEKIVRSVTLNSVTPRLLSRKVISYDQLEQLRAEQTELDKCLRLMHLIVNSYMPGACTSFVSALEEEYGWLMREINQAVTNQVEEQLASRAEHARCTQLPISQETKQPIKEARVASIPSRNPGSMETILGKRPLPSLPVKSMNSEEMRLLTLPQTAKDPSEPKIADTCVMSLLQPSQAVREPVEDSYMSMGTAAEPDTDTYAVVKGKPFPRRRQVQSIVAGMTQGIELQNMVAKLRLLHSLDSVEEHNPDLDGGKDNRKPELSEITVFIDRAYRGDEEESYGFDMKRRFGHNGAYDGFVVTLTMPGYIVAKTRALNVGDVITCINGREVDRMSEDEAREEVKYSGRQLALRVRKEGFFRKRELKIILQKQKQDNYGFKLVSGYERPRHEDDTYLPYVSKIFDEGVAAKEGSLRVGDTLKAINGQTLRSSTRNNIPLLLNKNPTELSLTVQREEYSALPFHEDNYCYI